MRLPPGQVTDTTTFTDEKRRAEVDAWLYETCTRTLQHIVDIVVQVGLACREGPGAWPGCRWGGQGKGWPGGAVQSAGKCEGAPAQSCGSTWSPPSNQGPSALPGPRPRPPALPPAVLLERLQPAGPHPGPAAGLHPAHAPGAGGGGRGRHGAPHPAGGAADGRAHLDGGERGRPGWQNGGRDEGSGVRACKLAPSTSRPAVLLLAATAVGRASSA